MRDACILLQVFVLVFSLFWVASIVVAAFSEHFYDVKYIIMYCTDKFMGIE